MSKKAKAPLKPPSNKGRVELLAAQLNEVVDAVNRNTRLFQALFANVEARIAVLTRAQQDLHRNGCVSYTLPVWDPESNKHTQAIDYEAYLQEYRICLHFGELLQWMKELVAASAAAEAEEDELDETVVVFGGK